jgi:probable HAF family extracellular repeat protein
MRNVSGDLAACLLLSLCADWAAAQQTYLLTELTDDGESSLAWAINASGQVTGVHHSPDDTHQHAFLWDGTLVRDLGTLGGDWSSGVAINRRGQVTGSSPTSINHEHAFLTDGVTMLDLGTLGGGFSKGVALNAAGHVTGTAQKSDGRKRAFLWNGSMLRDLGTLGGAESSGTAINGASQVTGAAQDAAGRGHAFVWDGTMMRDLGTLGGASSQGLAINSSGQVTGEAQISTGRTRAFFWDGTTMRNLGTLGGNFSSGRFINDAGQVAGVAEKRVDGVLIRRAFLWDGTTMRELDGARARGLNSRGQVLVDGGLSDGGPVYDLDELIDPKDPLKPHVKLGIGFGINNSGQIAAIGCADDPCGSNGGFNRGYLLTPVSYEIGFRAPTAGSAWKLGQTVPVKVALIDFDGTSITDARAADLAASPCRVTMSVSGAQTRSPVCMQYDAAANRFFFNWKVGAAGTGAATIQIKVVYGSPSKSTTVNTRRISIVS